MKNFDIIIIGAGPNGLSAASYLSKSGKKVLVVEKNEEVGGLAQYADSSSSLSKKVIDQLGLKINTKKKRTFVTSLNDSFNHTVLEIDENNSIKFNECEATLEDQNSFLKLIKKYNLFAKTLSSFMFNTPPRVKSGNKSDLWQLISMGWKVRKLGKKNMRELLRVIGLNIADDLEDNLTNDNLMGILCNEAVLGSNLGPRSPGSILTLLYSNAINGSIFRNNNLDTEKIISSIEQSCHDRGVEFLKSSEVKKLLINNETVTGIEMNDQNIIESSTIISTLDPKTTYLNLIGADRLDTDLIRRVTNFRSKGNVAKVKIEFKNIIKIKNLDEKYIGSKFIYAPNIKYIEHAFNNNKYNNYSKKPCLEFYIDNKNISANLYYIPYLKNGSHDKKEIESNIQLILNNFIDNNELIKFQIDTPNEMEKKYNTSGGHWHHGDMEIDQLLMIRPFYGSAQYETPINGLYICGAGTHPGGGITGINAINASKQLLKK